METLGKEEKSNKTITDYFCEKCDFNCCKKFNWDRHINTSKHINLTFGKEEKEQKEQKEQIYTCICGKKFKTNSGLWKHHNKCNYDVNKNSIEKTDDKNDKLIEYLMKENKEIKDSIDKTDDKNHKLIEYLMKENKEIKELILEIVKNGTHNTTNNNNHTNSHNKAFNLQFFLNETCKNAMNITDFVDSIKLQLSDLMEVGELGYVEGISKIIVKNLNNLDETVRPVHCTDKKRETMYIKDQGHWEKEDDKKTKLKKAINKIADKNIRLLPQFREKYPEYRNSSSKISDVHDKLVIEVMQTDNDKKDQIIKNISKVTTIKDK